MILAGIDIGTNTLRLLIAETSCGAFREIYSDRRITRLGQDLENTGSLSREAGDRSIRALSDFSDAIRRHGALQTSAIGTSALRTASNAQEFISEARQRTGLAITVVRGEEEARLTLLGVAWSLTDEYGKPGLPASALIVDIGGGSTEIITCRGSSAPLCASMPLGAVYLTERFLKTDPPAGQDIARLRSAVRGQLTAHCGEIGPDSSRVLVGTAGTVTTLAAMDQGLATYDPGRITGHVLSSDVIDGIVRKLSPLTHDARKAVRGLEQGREDIILAGAVVAQEILRWAGASAMLVSDRGLREGIVLDLYQKLNPHECAGTAHDKE
jgi:exopolyphosphatase / guanosine-5'-triphosphate,3'-diphosphate pyrophosphatase